jgi:hypothetical protein
VYGAGFSCVRTLFMENHHLDTDVIRELNERVVFGGCAMRLPKKYRWPTMTAQCFEGSAQVVA